MPLLHTKHKMTSVSTYAYTHRYVCHLFICSFAGSESPAGSQSHIALVAISCTLAVITAVLFVIVLCTCIHLRTKLGHTATDRPEYATPDSPPTTQAENTKENVYEIGGQPMCAELNAKEHDTPI